jgi:hypothetical protein
MVRQVLFSPPLLSSACGPTRRRHPINRPHQLAYHGLFFTPFFAKVDGTASHPATSHANAEGQEANLSDRSRCSRLAQI